LLLALASCSSSSSPPPAQQQSSGDDGGDSGGQEAAGPTITEHGIVLDYGTLLSSGKLVPVKGLTVSDGDQTTTTDATGFWSITLPASETLQGTVNGSSEGDAYSNLFLPAVTLPGGGDVDRGNIITPDVSTFQLERLSLTSDPTLAIVHVVVEASGSCSSVEGGTITVSSPSSAKVMYFDTMGYPSTTQSAFAALTDGRPVADIYDVPPGSTLAFQVVHPTCTQAPFPVVSGGGNFTGQVVTQASEPGDNNSALVAVLQ
jgi:hypothetical protein